MKFVSFTIPFVLSASIHLLLLSSVLLQSSDDRGNKRKYDTVKVKIVLSVHSTPPAPAPAAKTLPKPVLMKRPVQEKSVAPLMNKPLPEKRLQPSRLSPLKPCKAQEPCKTHECIEAHELEQALYSFTNSASPKTVTVASSFSTKKECIPPTPIIIKGLSRPPYPGYCRRHQQEGTVILTVLVNEKGCLDTIKVLKTSGYRRLDSAALRVLSKATFKAATINGSKVKAKKKVSFRFNLYE